MNENSGTIVLNSAEAGDHASVLVTGLGRSGTTMVSRVLSALGLFMGDQISRGSNEDKEFRTAIKHGSIADFELLCRNRDARFDRWGFKYPQARNKLPAYVAVMRSPRVIVTSRDPLATATRVASEVDVDILKVLDDTLRKTAGLLNTVQKLGCPVLLLSYEKALTRPQECVATIADFCGIKAEAPMLEAAAKAIRNDDPAYLSATR